MAKIDRQKVHEKCQGHCAYCGKEIAIKDMQVDHIEAHWHNMTQEKCDRVGIIKGSNDISNLMPACRRCNKWKDTFSIEQFRKEISLQVERLNKYNSNYRLALDYGMVKETNVEIKFYFERV